MMATPTMTWLRRRLGSDGNPLRRREDRIAAWLVPAWFLALLALGPAVASAAALWVHSGESAVQHAEQSWHEVPGVLLKAASGPLMTDNGANTWTVWALAKWSAAGRWHVGAVPVAAKSPAGSEVPVWLNKAGKVEVAPLSARQLGAYADTVTTIALAALAVFLAGIAWAVSRALDRRRLASWEAAWLVVGPRWSRQS